MSTVRKLGVICIDDENELNPAAYEHFLDVQNLRSGLDVQRALLREGRGRKGVSPDLILCDVNMKEAPEVADQEALADVFWGSDAGRPYGVLLALPFLGHSGLTTFIPYSNYWGTKTVHSNGYVLVALSLIRALSARCEQTLERMRTEIIAAGTRGSLADVPEDALRRGLVALRDRIESDTTLQLLDVDWALQRLAEVEERANRAGRGWSLDVPLRDSDGPIAVGIGWPSATVTFVEVGSLFADMMGFANPGRTEVSRIAEALLKWRRNKGSIERRGDMLFGTATQVLDACDPDTGRTSFIEAVDEAAYVKTGGDRYQLRRTAILFAWVRTWREQGPGARREFMTNSVHQQLGFVVRDEGGRETTDRNATTKYKGLLSQSRRAVPHDGPRRGFRVGVTVTEAYCLADDVVAVGLDANDRDLCIRYAEEMLDWVQPDAHPYPKWMTG